MLLKLVSLSHIKCNGRDRVDLAFVVCMQALVLHGDLIAVKDLI